MPSSDADDGTSRARLAHDRTVDDYVAVVRSPTRTALRILMRWLVLKPVSRFFLRIRVQGRHHCAKVDRPVIIVANHSSHWDSVLIHGYLPARIANGLATAAAADHFFAGRRPARSPRLFFNAFPVARSGRHKGRAPRGLTVALLAAGTSILIFPEGTRSRTGELGQFNPGAAQLAVKHRLPYLPIRITGTLRAWPADQSGPRLPRRAVSMIIFPPLTPEPGESAAAFNRRLRATIDSDHDPESSSGNNRT